MNEIPVLHKDMRDEIVRLRRNLHRYPSLSGKERGTVEQIRSFIEKHDPDRIHELLEGRGIAFEYIGKKNGKRIVFRADLDALPIQEELKVPWASEYEKISHKCGHDGHMSILAGLATLLNHQRPASGSIVLLFQPEEETGTGAAKVVNDRVFKQLDPDYVFGLHNLPGYPLHQVILKDGSFAAASKGLILKLKGKSSHAGHPENGTNPARAIARIIEYVHSGLKQEDYDDFILATIIHIRLGEIAFGTSPGEADFMLTLRSFLNSDMEKLVEKINEKINKIAREEGLLHNISFTEEFPATVNDSEGVKLLKEVATENNFNIKLIEEPFRWSEDFGHYSMRYPGAFFGLGSGQNSPQLHNPDYDFPDEIIETGIKIFYGIYKKISGE